jgi:hypothetical protein
MQFCCNWGIGRPVWCWKSIWKLRMQAEMYATTWAIEYGILSLSVSLSSHFSFVRLPARRRLTDEVNFVGRSSTNENLRQFFVPPILPFKLNPKMGGSHWEGFILLLYQRVQTEYYRRRLPSTEIPPILRLGGGSAEGPQMLASGIHFTSMRFCHVEAVEDKWNKVGYLVTE